MMKYSFLVLESQHEEFLNHLSSLGVIDVTINEYTPSLHENDMIARLKELQTLQSNVMMSASGYKDLMATAVGFDGSVEQYEQKFYSAMASVENSKNTSVTLLENLNTAKPWGEFSKESIQRLSENGVKVRFLVSQDKAYDEVTKDHATEKISSAAGSAYFIWVTTESDVEIEDMKNVREVDMPKSTYGEIDKQLKIEAESFDVLRKDIASLIATQDIIKKEIDSIKENLTYHKIKNSNQKVADNSLVSIVGWAPKSGSDKLDAELEAIPSAIFFKDAPTIEEEPPVLLKNGRLAASAEVITKLYSLPNYNEVDMTPFFAPFFMLFVGLCLGDCGYGLLLVIGALVAKAKVKAEDMQKIIDLVLFCGISTMVVGFIMGVFFGVELGKTELFAPIQGLFISTNDMFGLSMVIGMIQIIYAIILRSVISMRRFGFLYGLSGFGWVIIIISTICAMALPKIGINSFTTDSIPYYVVAGFGGFLMFFFQDPKKGPIMNFGMGIWALYGNVTGLLGDVLSYVRLFALGLTGGVIAGVFNELAISMSGDIPVLSVIIMILIMVFGHGINLFISSIGSLVHPLRLTFVEFYKNAGFEGGGHEYNPFKRNK